MTLNGVIIQMKGNYPNPTLPSALQYLWLLSPLLVPPTAHTPPSQTIHHIHHLIPPVLPFLPFLLVPHNVLLPSSSQPFMPSSLGSPFINPCLSISCPFTCQNTPALLFAVFYFSLFSHSCCLSFCIFIYSLCAREPLTELVTKALYEWEHLCTSYFYFEVNANCALIFTTCVCG